MSLQTRKDGRGNGDAKGNGNRDGRGDGSDRRNNAALAAVVDQGIRFDKERGAALAWAYLAQHGVPPETILRVLQAPAGGPPPRRNGPGMIDGAPFRR